MEFLNTFLLAVLVAFVGFMPPGMINMTSLKMSLEHHRREAVLFVSGAVTVILVQAFLAVTFAKYLARNPQIIEYLTYAAIVVFLGLALLFFRQARKKVKMQVEEPKRNSYLAGMTMSSMNMLAIPFFLGYSTLMEAKGWLNLNPPHNYVFSIGAVAGSFLLFFLYVLFAEYIQKRVQFIAQNINYILSLLFLTLAVITIYNTFLA
jgi:threonine/homoserine/homoserine lactone efflux protein